MLKKLTTILISIASTALVGAPATSMMLTGNAFPVTIEFGTLKSAPIPAYVKPADKPRYSNSVVEVEKGGWREIKIPFVNSKAQSVHLSIQPKSPMYFDDLKLDGKPVGLEGFEDDFTGWNKFPRKDKNTPQINESATIAFEGAKCLFVNKGAATQYAMKVSKGHHLFSIMARAADLKNEPLPPYCLDLSKAAAQFPQIKKFSCANSANTLPKDVCGAKFAPLSKPVMTSGGKTFTVKIGAKQYGNCIYLLQTAYADGAAKVGTVAVKFANGEVEKFPIATELNIGNFFAETKTRNARAIKVADGWIYAARFKFSGRNGRPEEIYFINQKGRTWTIFAATLDNSDIDLSETWTPAAPEWLKADMGDMSYKAGSVFDLSANVEPQAGKYGRLMINKNGDFAFEKRPNEKLVFATCMAQTMDFRGDYLADSELTSTHKNADFYAEHLKRNGFRMVRFSGLTAYFKMLITPSDKIPRDKVLKLIDAADYAVYALKKRGIYLNMIMPSYDIGLPNFKWENRDAVKFGFFSGDEASRKSWKRIVDMFLNHINPYTAMAYKDDPVVASIEYVNEVELGPERTFARNPQSRAGGEKIWREWLVKKYQKISELNKVWKRDFKSFDDIKWTDTVNNHDWRLYLLDCGRKFQNFCGSVVREAGYDGLIMQYNVIANYTYDVLRAEASDFVGMNTYFAHPTDFNNKGSECIQGSSLRYGVGYWRGIAATRIAGRPIIMTERKHVFWNPHQYEGGLAFPAYSALQGFSGVSEFVRSGEWHQSKIEPFSTSNNPVSRANELFSYCFLARGDVEKSKHRIDLVIAKDFIEKNPLAVYAPSMEQTKIALLTGFATFFPDLKYPKKLAEVKIAAPDIKVAPVGYATIRAEDWFANVEKGTGANFDIKGFVETLRKKNILTPDNITDIDAGIFQSDTKQITLYTKRNMLKVLTPKSEAVAILAGDTEKLGALDVISTSVNAAVGVCAMDGKNISESSRLVLVYSTQAINTDMKLSSDKIVLKDFGRLPVLMKAGRLTATLKLKNGSKFSVYPLCVTGERRTKINLPIKNGSMQVSIDTSQLPDGPTPFFEIVEER